ncbi:MAG: hypothetical protein HQL69_17515 [Magnetococcales bacterium]|nr:hypothetical protein [Magnetococcales bacterium]
MTVDKLKAKSGIVEIKESVNGKVEVLYTVKSAADFGRLLKEKNFTDKLTHTYKNALSDALEGETIRDIKIEGANTNARTKKIDDYA